ncbi:hypothetical protein BDY19DRAFT_538463 [Irpex rosettiformis]|uniref:Uncharacterized protein n=1 Tax=Irpex rosettiformis TaxID=378272 RepID=A0ACB8TQT0_9APHY|nr:hypothetical protein BDY19DRAFT_538463 [Irpex rosettiformis]
MIILICQFTGTTLFETYKAFTRFTMDSNPPSQAFPLELILMEMGVNLTLGVAISFGLIVTMLYGITSVQTFIYFSNEPRDGKYMKSAVFALWIIDTLGAIVSGHVVYRYCVQALLNPILWTQFGWSNSVTFILLSFSNAIVTAVFANRLWRLEGKIWSLILILPPAILAFIGGQAIGIYIIIIKDFLELRRHITWLYYTVFALQVFSDIAIMISLCIALLRRRSPIGRPRSVIGILILFSINTCLLTSSVGLAALLTNALSPKTFFWQGLDAVLPKVMLNALLALLNSHWVLLVTGQEGARLCSILHLRSTTRQTPQPLARM